MVAVRKFVTSLKNWVKSVMMLGECVIGDAMLWDKS